MYKRQSLGCDRVALAFLCEAYDEEHLPDSQSKEDIRTVLHLHPALAPYKCSVLPLSKKPVSYTHLDVYKRQGHGILREKCIKPERLHL